MAERLERYRASSLGELLQAQQAAQAAIDSLPDPVVVLDAERQAAGREHRGGRRPAGDRRRAPAPRPFAGVDPGVRGAGRSPARARARRQGRLRAAGASRRRCACRRARRASASSCRAATPIYGESGAVTGAAIVLQDVTRLFRFDELKNDLVATVAHEFRTPLTSLRMAIHLCPEEVVGPADGEAGRPAVRRARRLRAAAGHRRRAAQPVAHRVGPIDLHRRAPTPRRPGRAGHRRAPHRRRGGQVATRRRGAARAARGVRRSRSPAARVHQPAQQRHPLRARGQRDRRARRPESPSRRASTGAGSARSASRSRQGPGIPREHQAGLFEKFFRVPGSPEGGSGLGLFIAKGIVQAHGGEIGVDSTPGRGATFWFTVLGENLPT